MHLLIGALLIFLIPLGIAIPYILLEASRPLSPYIALLIVWAMFGLGYAYGKREQRHQDLQREQNRLREKELDDHDKSRGIGKYYKSSK